MKNLLIGVLSLLLMSACGSENSYQENSASSSVPTRSKTTQNFTEKDNFVRITLSDGPWQGSQIFKSRADDLQSQINLGFDDGVSNFNARNLRSEDGQFEISYLTRPFVGEANVGTYPAKAYTKDCGLLRFSDLKNQQDYDRIDAKYLDCTETQITLSTEWEEGTVYNRRFVKGQFKDQLQLEIRDDQGEIKVVEYAVEVSFLVRESRLK